MSPQVSRHIALVGMPGAGKTTIGALLAERLALPFRDSDTEIERESGETIAQLFAAYGEAHFRTLERATIDRLLDGAPLILATGGGAMAEAATRRLLLARTTTIWLDAPPGVLATRLADQPDRPLLAGDLNKRLEMIRIERESAYCTAAHRVDAAPLPDAVIAAIFAALTL